MKNLEDNMKRQIRNGVFETNSSTQHALVIKSQYRNRQIADGIPEGVTLPEKVQLYSMYSKYAQRKNTGLTKIENRINYLFNAMMDWQVDKSYLIRFLSYLSKLGINYELCDLDPDASYYNMLPEDFVEEIMSPNHEDNFLAFIFADDIFYDSYADDCGSWEQQCEWEDTVSKFATGDDTISFRTRC